MQIREITEGFAGEIGKAMANRFTQSAIGVDAFEKDRYGKKVPATATSKVADPASATTEPAAAPAAASTPAAAAPAVPAAAAAPTPAAQDQGIMVAPGRRIRVVDPKTRGVYFKTVKGWFNEINQPVGATGVAYLERLADQGLGKEEIIPKAPVKPVARGPQRQRKRR